MARREPGGPRAAGRQTAMDGFRHRRTLGHGIKPPKSGALRSDASRRIRVEALSAPVLSTSARKPQVAIVLRSDTPTRVLEWNGSQRKDVEVVDAAVPAHPGIVGRFLVRRPAARGDRGGAPFGAEASSACPFFLAESPASAPFGAIARKSRSTVPCPTPSTSPTSRCDRPSAVSSLTASRRSPMLRRMSRSGLPWRPSPGPRRPG
jgi:hypothetical protein